jgi:hypothetical protein
MYSSHRSLGRLASVFACVFAAVVSLQAFAEGSLNVMVVHGGNQGVYTDANTSGWSTYTKTRVLGFSGSVLSCQRGSMEGGYCVGSATWTGTSYAGMRANVDAYGWQTGESVHFEGGQTVAHITHDVYGGEPPSGPSDGSCEAGGGADYENSCSPIVIDTSVNSSDRYRLTSVDKGVAFDLNADGVAEQTAWVMNGDQVALLAIDRNGNGSIDNGSELFGNVTLPGVGNGFRALADLEPHNRDGVLDARDPLFAKLLLWYDRDRNGVSAPRELVPAYTVLDAVGLGYTPSGRVDAYGNQFRFAGFARRLRPGADGLAKRAKNQFVEDDPAREFPIYDVFFRNRN